MTVGAVWVAFDGLRVAVRSSAPEVLAEVRQAFRAMVVDGRHGGEAAPAVAEFRIDRAADGYEVTGDGVPAPEHGPLAAVRRAVRFHVTRVFVEARAERLWLHAAAAHRGKRALLLPGQRGRGKSTLVAGLARAGWRYLSDEAVPLDMADDHATPYPLTPQVRVGPGTALDAEAVAVLGKQDVALEPSVVCRGATRITEVVFVRYAPAATAALTPMTPGEAVLGLLESCLNFREHGSRAVRYAADLAGRVPAATLTFGDVSAAVRLLDRGATG